MHEQVKRKTSKPPTTLCATQCSYATCERVFYNGKFLVWYVVGKTQVCHMKNKISWKVGKLNCAFVRKRKINECCWRHFIFLNLQHSCRLRSRRKKNTHLFVFNRNSSKFQQNNCCRSYYLVSILVVNRVSFYHRREFILAKMWDFIFLVYHDWQEKCKNQQKRIAHERKVNEDKSLFWLFVSPSPPFSFMRFQ